MAHTPVLLHRMIEATDPSPGEFVVDGTLGGGGHAREFIERIKPGGTFLGIDWDKNAIEAAREKLDGEGLKKLVLRHGNYADLKETLEEENLGNADVLFIDLGFSSDQLTAGRGFSFQNDEPLLMTYSDEATPAHTAIRQLRKRELAEVIKEFSDERYADRIAEAIYERGRKQRIKTSGELAEVVRSAVPKHYEGGRIDPATRTFQAVRMYVNDELGNLEHLLQNLQEVMNSGGRAAIISFHSKEDRLVKNYFRDLEKDNQADLITKKPIQANEAEIKNNPKSRSAKLRAIKIT